MGRALFGNQSQINFATDIDELYEEAVNQAVLPLIYCSLTESEKDFYSKDISLKWEKKSYNYIVKNQRLLFEQNTIIELLKENNIKFAILKGSSCAVNYPDPLLRAMGDIDILVSPQEQVKTVKLLQKNGYSDIYDKSHHCHFTIRKNGITVEVHKEPNGLFINEDSIIKEKLNDFFSDALETVKTETGIPMLDDKHQALVLIIHKLEHFLSGGLGLRQVCDWAVFVEKRLTIKLWKELEPIIYDMGLLVFTNAITKVCIDYLGLPQKSVPFEPKCDLELLENIINHIMHCGNFGIKDKAYGEHFFVDAHSKSRISSFFKVMNSACKKHWPICDKYSILRPIAPFVVYGRYIILRLKGERDRFEPIKLYKRSASKHELYKEIMPFIAKNQNNEDKER